MKPTRYRVGLRTLLIAVAVVAMIFSAVSMYLRSRSYRENSERWAVSERLRLDIEAVWSRHVKELEGDPSHPELERARVEARKAAASAARAAELKRKYARAARYPWLSVAPDPPEPE